MAVKLGGYSAEAPCRESIPPTLRALWYRACVTSSMGECWSPKPVVPGSNPGWRASERYERGEMWVRVVRVSQGYVNTQVLFLGQRTTAFLDPVMPVSISVPVDRDGNKVSMLL